MCLVSISKYQVKTTIGYKKFDNNNGHLFFQFRGRMQQLPIGKWIKEIDYRSRDDIEIEWIHADREGKYHPGFHVYLDKYGDTNLRKVKFRNILVKGWQSGSKVVVAKEIYIFPLRK